MAYSADAAAPEDSVNDSHFGGSLMQSNKSPTPAIASVGRIAVWIVLAVLAAAAVYAAVIAVINWGPIGV